MTSESVAVLAMFTWLAVSTVVLVSMWACVLVWVAWNQPRMGRVQAVSFAGALFATAFLWPVAVVTAVSYGAVVGIRRVVWGESL